MGKVSIGLRGWRFEESEVFEADDSFRPLEEMSSDVRDRVLRLTALVGSPCDACWLLHGDEHVERCNVAELVYGEPSHEVVLCAEHEPDFLYWYHEAGGERFRGQSELQNAFHEWFADGGRAPEGYAGLEHVDTAPEQVPVPPDPDLELLSVELPESERERIDLHDPKDRHDPEEES